MAKRVKALFFGGFDEKKTRNHRSHRSKKGENKQNRDTRPIYFKKKKKMEEDLLDADDFWV